MVVSKVFDYETMKLLTHGIVEKLTSSGRMAARWLGATSEFSDRLGSNGQVSNIVDRGGTVLYRKR